jgi:hypothetical protein
MEPGVVSVVGDNICEQIIENIVVSSVGMKSVMA